MPSLVSLYHSFRSLLGKLVSNFSKNSLHNKIDTLTSNLGDFEIKLAPINLFFRQEASDLTFVFTWKNLFLNIYLNEVAKKNSWGNQWKILTLEDFSILYSFDSEFVYSFFGSTFAQVEDKKRFSVILADYDVFINRDETQDEERRNSNNPLNIFQSQMAISLKPEIILPLIQILGSTNGFRNSSVIHILKKLLLD